MKTLLISLFLLSTTIVIDGARLSPQDKNLVVDVPYGPRHAMFNFDEVSLESRLDASPQDKSLVVEVPLGSRNAVFNFDEGPDFQPEPEIEPEPEPEPESESEPEDPTEPEIEDRIKIITSLEGYESRPNTVVRYDLSRGDDDDEEEDEDQEEEAMDISETLRCYVYGQCQGYTVNFKYTEFVDQCHRFCGENKNCNWWTWEPALELCMLYVNCTNPPAYIDQPAVEPCPGCISGQKMCPARECHGAFKCQGNVIDSFAIATLEECIEMCNYVLDCQWFTLEKAHDHCILYEECDDKFDCETCATGTRNCAHGYHGKLFVQIQV